MRWNSFKTRCIQHAPTLFVGACCVTLDLLILGYLIAARTSEPISSPWPLVPTGIFALFALATAFLCYGARILPSRFFQGLLMLHALAAYGAATIVYRLGFGFDPFIHQAAEQHLVRHGSISLKTPLYVGQYVLVWALEAITGLSVIRIDQWLIPTLSVALIPLLFRAHHLLPITLLLLPVSFFSFTIPFHLALLFFLYALCITERPSTRATLPLLALCAIASLAAHPLMGIPCALFVAGYALQRTQWQRYASLVPAIGIPLGMLGAMALYATLEGARLALPSLQEVQRSLIILFGTSHRFSSQEPWLSLLYGFISLWPFVFCVLGIREYLREPTQARRYRLLTALGILASAILLAACIRLPDIIAHEQFEFPLRLLRIVPLLFAPDIAALLKRLLFNNKTHASLVGVGVSLVVGLIAASQWFVSYPQRNSIAPAYAPSVSVHEYETIAWIERVRDAQPFVVLSHQMLAAAALQTHGFEQTITTCHGTHLSYAIPTGGALYQDVLALTRGRNTKETVERLRECYGNVKLFVVLPKYWDPEGRVRQSLAPHAGETHVSGAYLSGYLLR